MSDQKNTKASKKQAQKAQAQAKKNEAKAGMVAAAISDEHKPQAQTASILKFQACDEKSFFLHKTPSVLGSEDPLKWKLLVTQQDKSIDKELFGHSIMTQFSLS